MLVDDEIAGGTMALSARTVTLGPKQGTRRGDQIFRRTVQAHVNWPRGVIQCSLEMGSAMVFGRMRSSS